MSRLRHTVAWLLAATLGLAVADPPAELSPRWAERLLGLEQADLEPVDPPMRAAIEAARAELGQALLEESADPLQLAEQYGRLGGLYFLVQLQTSAERAWRNAQRLDPHQMRWPYLLAHLALNLGQSEAALAHLARVAELEPDYPPLPLRRGTALAGLNRLQEAEAAFRSAAEKAGLRAAALAGLARLAALQRDFAASRDLYLEALELQPQADALRYPLAQALIQLGKRDAAREQMARKGTTEPQVEDPILTALEALRAGPGQLLQQGMRAVSANKLDEARDYFARGVDADPGNSKARTTYARVLWLTGAGDQAAAELERVVAEDPARLLAAFLLGVIAEGRNDLPTAGRQYRQVIAADPTHEGALARLAALEMGAGQFAAAAALFERAVSANPSVSELSLNLWAARLASGADQSALLQQAAELHQRFPEPPMFRLLQIRLQALADDPAVADPAAALVAAEQFASDAWVPPVRELLATVQAAAGDYEAARATIQALLNEGLMMGAPPMALAGPQRLLQQFEAAKLPEPRWDFTASFYAPPPVNLDQIMRNYPDPTPY